MINESTYGYGRHHGPDGRRFRRWRFCTDRGSLPKSKCKHPRSCKPQREQSGAPAAGANSFTEAQAKSRIEKAGYSNVSDLIKDKDGIWKGKGAVAILCWNLIGAVSGSIRDTWSGSEVNRLIGEFLGQALPSVHFAHRDLTWAEQMPRTTSLPSRPTAAMLFWGTARLRSYHDAKVDGWQSLTLPPMHPN